MKIAFQGERGAYSETASLLFKPGCDPQPSVNLEDVFAAVEKREAEAGVVPLENSTGGTIHRTYDLLLQHDLTIVGEVEMRVVHSLIALPGTTIDQLTHIYSHPQAIAQCERFLRARPHIEVVATYDTAGSARTIRDRQLRASAAIASERAARLYELDILQTGIQDYDDNFTRFLVIAHADTPGIRAVDPSTSSGSSRATSTDDSAPGKPSKKDATRTRTTIAFRLTSEPGALFRALGAFALRGIDLTKLESRPIPGRPWEYLFYADLDVAHDEPRCEKALGHLGEFAPMIRVLGSYTAWRRTPPSATAGAAQSKARAQSIAPGFEWALPD